MIGYDGRRFSPATDTPATDTPATDRPATDSLEQRPIAHYHQHDDLVWGEFAGGDVRRGSLAGTSDTDGVLRFAYCMVLDNGRTLVGVCRSVPEILDDGRIRLTEYWERFGDGADTGISVLEELPTSSSAHR